MNTKIIIIAVLTFLVTFVLYFCVVINVYPDLLIEHQFQDLFAGISTFFSGLAFLGLVGAILLQREELSLQRKELELTRTELRRTAKAQEKSEIALSKQAESLKVTAKLNGLGAMLQNNQSLMEVIAMGKYGISGVDQNLKKKSEEIIEKIEDIIREK